MEKYLELRNDYSKRTKSLEQALKSETQFIGENHALTDAVRQLQIGNDKMMNEAAKTRSYCETKTYDGDWEMTYRPDPSGYTTKRARLIQGNVGVNINGEEKEVFKIIKIGYDSTSNEIIMIIADSREVDVPFHIIFRPQSLSLSILKNADEKGVITALVRP